MRAQAGQGCAGNIGQQVPGRSHTLGAVMDTPRSRANQEQQLFKHNLSLPGCCPKMPSMGSLPAGCVEC